MKIAEGLEMLEISTNIMGAQGIINPTVMWDNDTVILVDTGLPGQVPLIRAAIEGAGIPFEKINKVILTHQDIDHVGGLASMLKELPNRVEVLAHNEEKAYIQGKKIPVKVAKLEANINNLPQEMKDIYLKLKAFYENNKTNIDKNLSEGEVLPCCGGITVIHTPGHTPGHICLYHNQSKTLIAGDSLNVEGGLLVKAAQSTTFDMDASIESLKKLLIYDIETIICYHGGLYRGNVKERIAELANG